MSVSLNVKLHHFAFFTQNAQNIASFARVTGACT